ncbi:universal stress protein (plasmid) [Bacillaceae bacterium JMAK1]|nr:universal stress protein [Bacillaceae bacterium JMAK1]
MFKHILIATDGSDNANRAIEKAVEMVEPYKEHVSMDLVYCIDGDTSKKDILKYGDAELADIKRRKMFANKLSYLEDQGIKTENVFLHGEPAKTILTQLDSKPYDCVVVGSRGMNEFQTLILGSVSHKLAKYVKIPLLIVK